MAKGCKCDPHDICEECPEWIFTLADLIMCMMGLFVILWVLKPGFKTPPSASSPTTADDLTKTVAAIREAFGYQPDPSSKDPVDIYMIFQQIQRIKSNGPGEKGKLKVTNDAAQGTDPEVTSIRLSKQTTAGGRILFEPGGAALNRAGGATVAQIVDQIRGHRNIVMVKGHTALDDLPEKSTAQQRMDLSLRRAQLVADALVEHGVSPDILRVQGCSTFEPVQQRIYTPGGLAINRRVEVEITSTLVEDLQDRPASATTQAVSLDADPR